MKLPGFFSWLLAALITALLSPAHAETFITIGTGGVTGVYYPAGGAICRLINIQREQHGIRCAVESTDGSIYNLNAIRENDLELGIAQSDWQYHAYLGTSAFTDQGPFKSLRTVFSIYAEPFTVVARADAGIKTFADLKGKRVNIGNPGSGQRATMEVLMKAMGWSKKNFAKLTELNAAEQSRALCENKIDAMVFTAGHPNNTIKEATTACNSVIIPVTGPVVNKLIEENEFYQPASIPGGMYRGTPETVNTFGIHATLVTSARMKDEVIYQVVKSVFEHFDTFRKLHPALTNLDPKMMMHNGLAAPLHDGAKKYFQEIESN
ncbi:TAXI family TRAP transporter solute-binding subunit [Photobacterium atrarenae]|uniref:TAXI family TRAP transporter solute-binding subunit n=1 Tax=Photobacterium atrarenae TaxID=865757 RepID=A0ABY5GB98_9GAMM|nr:TAXI family TRAP transporter solute-binding subunit [Photobacterium atrarenae]UTV26431.1 TAXI family TRAP transporter solute-binding subunit [Photobacterium atrarenae]